MKTIGFNIDECRRALESYAAEVGELMGRVREPDKMTVPEIEEARGQLSALKACLRRDCKLRSTTDGRAKMTAVEAVIFAPAVHQALADLHVSVTARPDKRWFSELYNIQISIRHALANLEHWGK